MKTKILVLISVFLLLFVGTVLADMQYQGQTAFTNPVAVATSVTCGTYTTGNGIVKGGNSLVQWPVTNPTDLAIDSACNVYVAGNELISVFDSAGNPMGTPWAVTNPVAIAINSVGDVYVAGNGLIQVFDSMGNPIMNGNQALQWPVTNPVAITINSVGDVYVAGNGLIQVFDSIGNPVVAPWECINATGVAIDPSGSVYATVANEGFGDFIDIYTATGSYLGSYGNIGTFNGCFNINIFCRFILCFGIHFYILILYIYYSLSQFNLIFN